MQASYSSILVRAQTILLMQVPVIEMAGDIEVLIPSPLLIVVSAIPRRSRSYTCEMHCSAQPR